MRLFVTWAALLQILEAAATRFNLAENPTTICYRENGKPNGDLGCKVYSDEKKPQHDGMARAQYGNYFAPVVRKEGTGNYYLNFHIIPCNEPYAVHLYSNAKHTRTTLYNTPRLNGIPICDPGQGNAVFELLDRNRFTRGFNKFLQDHRPPIPDNLVELIRNSRKENLYSDTDVMSEIHRYLKDVSTPRNIVDRLRGLIRENTLTTITPRGGPQNQDTCRGFETPPIKEDPQCAEKLPPGVDPLSWLQDNGYESGIVTAPYVPRNGDALGEKLILNPGDIMVHHGAEYARVIESSTGELTIGTRLDCIEYKEALEAEFKLDMPELKPNNFRSLSFRERQAFHDACRQNIKAKDEHQELSDEEINNRISNVKLKYTVDVFTVKNNAQQAVLTTQLAPHSADGEQTAPGPEDNNQGSFVNWLFSLLSVTALYSLKLEMQRKIEAAGAVTAYEHNKENRKKSRSGEKAAARAHAAAQAQKKAAAQAEAQAQKKAKAQAHAAAQAQKKAAAQAEAQKKAQQERVTAANAEANSANTALDEFNKTDRTGKIELINDDSKLSQLKCYLITAIKNWNTGHSGQEQPHIKDALKFLVDESPVTVKEILNDEKITDTHKLRCIEIIIPHLWHTGVELTDCLKSIFEIDKAFESIKDEHIKLIEKGKEIKAELIALIETKEKKKLFSSIIRAIKKIYIPHKTVATASPDDAAPGEAEEKAAEAAPEEEAAAPVGAEEKAAAAAQGEAAPEEAEPVGATDSDSEDDGDNGDETKKPHAQNTANKVIQLRGVFRGVDYLRLIKGCNDHLRDLYLYTQNPNLEYFDKIGFYWLIMRYQTDTDHTTIDRIKHRKLTDPDSVSIANDLLNESLDGAGGAEGWATQFNAHERKASELDEQISAETVLSGNNEHIIRELQKCRFRTQEDILKFVGLIIHLDTKQIDINPRESLNLRALRNIISHLPRTISKENVKPNDSNQCIAASTYLSLVHHLAYAALADDETFKHIFKDEHTRYEGVADTAKQIITKSIEIIKKKGGHRAAKKEQNKECRKLARTLKSSPPLPLGMLKDPQEYQADAGADAIARFFQEGGGGATATAAAAGAGAGAGARAAAEPGAETATATAGAPKYSQHQG